MSKRDPTRSAVELVCGTDPISAALRRAAVRAARTLAVTGSKRRGAEAIDRELNYRELCAAAALAIRAPSDIERWLPMLRAALPKKPTDGDA